MSYIPITLNVAQLTQQQVQQMDGANLIQPNTFRNISIPRRRQAQYSVHEEHRKSVDPTLYQYRNPFPPQQLQYQQQQPIQPQNKIQMYQIQQSDQKYDPYLQSKPYYTSIQQQIQEKNKLYIQNQNASSNTNNYPLSYSSYANQVEQIPLQYNQQLINSTNQQPQYGTSLLKYNIVSSSNGKYSENEKQQIAKIAAKYRELKQINTNLMKKRHSIDGSQYIQSDPQSQLNNSYQVNNKFITPSNNSFISQSQNTSDLSLLYNQTPTVSQKAYAFQRLSVPVNTKESENNQNYQERLTNGIILGNTSNNTVEQNNISLNTSFNNDNFLSKPRSYSLSIRGDLNLQYPIKQNYDKIQSPVYKQPAMQNYLQNQTKLYGQSANPSQNTNSINTSLNANNFQSQTPYQNIRVLKTNINHHNQPTQINLNYKNDEDKKQQKNNQTNLDQYQSDTMKRNVNSYKKQESEGNPIFKAIINAHQARRQILSNSIHIQSVEVLNSAEKQQQNKENENIDREGQNIDIQNQKQQNLDHLRRDNEEKENIAAVKQVNTFSNNSSVVIEYNEVYKQDRIPISHAKMTQSKLVCDNHNSSIQSKLNQALAKEINVMKQSETLKQVPVQNLEDVKKFVDEQVKQIQIQCQAKYKQKQNLNDEDKTSKSAYFIKENSLSNSKNNQMGEGLIKSFNTNKINQNVDTSLNCSDLLQLSLSGLVTPITNNYQSNQQTDQKEAIQIFNNYQPSDRSLNEQKDNLQRQQEQNKQTLKEEQEFQKIDVKQSESVPQSSRSNNQLPTPPSDPNTKTSFYHKKNICKIAETFTFNTNLSSIQTQGSIDYNKIHNHQNQDTTKSNYTGNPIISRSPIEQIRYNQQQILKVDEKSLSCPSQNDITNKNEAIINSKEQEKVDQIADLEVSHQKLITIHSQYLSQNNSKQIKNFQNQDSQIGNDVDKNSIQQQILNNDQTDYKNTKSSIMTDINLKNEKNICDQYSEEIQNNSQNSPDHFSNQQGIFQQCSQTNNSVSQQDLKQKEIEIKDLSTENSPKIDEKIIEEFADSLYYQLNIERSLLQLKSGLSRKITELDHILPIYENDTNDQNNSGRQRGEYIESYRNRLNKILGTNYSIHDLNMIFQITNKGDNHEEGCPPDTIIKKEDILEVLLGTQNLTVTSKSQEISEETKKIIRNIIKETLRAQISFKEIKQKYKEFQYQLFLHISNGNKEIVTYSDFKAFLIKNGYQVRDQEMMLLIYRFHQPNTIRLTIQQFQFKN
ncbi:hypothetical protein ABPG74_015696 [Tetrahymena malaccensis]